MTAMTLEYSGTEKALGDWGFDQDTAEMLQANAGMDVFMLGMPAAMDSDPIISFEGQVIVRSGRAGSGTSWSGGQIEFQGKRLMAVLDGRPEYEGIFYQFGGPWYDIDQTAYQQTVYYWVGPLSTDTSSYLVSDLVLFQKVTAPGVVSYRNNGEQIQDVLQHVLDEYSAQSMAAPYQIGTISPAVNQQTYQVKDIKCSEAIQMCLRCSPDVTVSFDYSFSPPKVNVLKQASMATASLPIADAAGHESIRLTPRYDLQARSVVLYFKQTNTLNGIVLVQTTKQKYPALGVEGGLRVLVQTIDLAGYAVNTVSGKLVCNAVANTQAWWEKYIPELASSKIASFSVGSMTILDEGGSAVSLTDFPNTLDDGSIADWMVLGSGPAVTGTRVTITAVAAYIQKDDAGRSVQVFSKKELSARVTLTNGVTDSYTTVASAVGGEAVPASMAQDIYTALATLQYEGTLSFVQGEISGMPTVANVLNLSGGRTEWTTMKALIQTVRRKWGSGRTEITIGPARHLTAADLTQLFLINRLRRVYMNPATQATAQLSTNGTVALGANVTKENTNSGLDESNLLVLAAALTGSDAAMVRHDAGGQSIVIGKFDSSLAQLASTSKTTIANADLEDDGTKRTAQFRWLTFKDSSDCSLKKAKFLMTTPEAA